MENPLKAGDLYAVLKTLVEVDTVVVGNRVTFTVPVATVAAAREVLRRYEKEVRNA